MKTNEFIYQVNQIDGRWSVDDYGPSLVVRTSRTKRETFPTDVLWVSKSDGILAKSQDYTNFIMTEKEIKDINPRYFEFAEEWNQ